MSHLLATEDLPNDHWVAGIDVREAWTSHPGDWEQTGLHVVTILRETNLVPRELVDNLQDAIVAGEEDAFVAWMQVIDWADEEKVWIQQS